MSRSLEIWPLNRLVLKSNTPRLVGNAVTLNLVEFHTSPTLRGFRSGQCSSHISVVIPLTTRSNLKVRLVNSKKLGQITFRQRVWESHASVSGATAPPLPWWMNVADGIKFCSLPFLLVVSLNVEKTVTITIAIMHAVSSRSLNGFSCDELEDLHVHYNVHDTALSVIRISKWQFLRKTAKVEYVKRCNKRFMWRQ